MNKDVDPVVSKYMSDLAKKRKNPYYGFKDKNLAKEAGDKGRQTQKVKRENRSTRPSSSPEK